MLQKPIYIGNDHGGYELKQSIMEHLKKRGIAYIDTGSSTREIVRYPYYAAKIAGAVSRGEADRGILICSTGIGMSILANRFKGVRASLCTDTYMANAWLDTEYEAGRHSISLELIGEAEEHLSQPITPQQEELFHDFNR